MTDCLPQHAKGRVTRLVRNMESAKYRVTSGQLTGRNKGYDFTRAVREAYDLLGMLEDMGEDEAWLDKLARRVNRVERWNVGLPV